MNQKKFTPLVLIGCLFTFINSALSQGSAFTYQGRLNAGGVAANGYYDLSFTLFATNASGVAIAGPVTNSATFVSNGLFTAAIDFGAGTFVGNSNWLEIAVSTNSANNFSTLTPRQQLTPVPYAVFANTASNLSGIVLNSSLPVSPAFSGTVTATSYQTGGNGSFVAGGGNSVSGQDNAIGGGTQNTNTSTYATIGGGYNNRTTAGGSYLTIGGGRFNIATANDATIAGGVGNSNSAAAATIGGGYNNIASQNNSTIGGGQFNTVSGPNATVGGGQYNTAGPGDSATVPGGNANLASGIDSFAAGANAAATNKGAFVWSDAEGTTFSSTNSNSFNVRANGGVLFATAGAGVRVDGASVLTATSGAIPSYAIDDGGSSAYQAVQQTVGALGGDATVPFSSLSPVAAGGSASLSLTINGAAFGSVIGFSGCEEMSKGYSYVVEVTNSTAIGNPDSELGLTASLTFSRNGRSTTFGGIVTACASAAGNTSSFLYTVRIVSPLNYYLDRTTDYQIFQQSTLTAILTTILNSDAAGSPMVSNLTGTYPTRDSLTQFGESDLNFVNRILENEGIFYFFNQGASPPSLIVGDNTAAYLASPNSPFNYYGNTTTNIPPGTEFIRSFQKASHQNTAQSVINAAPFPNVNLSVLESSAVTAGIGQYYEYGNDVATVLYDNQLADYRQDIQTAAHAAISGTGTAPDLRAGYTFTLADQTGAGLGGSYVVTSVHHAGFIRVTNGVSTLFYGNAFQVIPASLAYRPPLTTPKPHAEPCTAVVTGPTANQVDEIHTDIYGRAKVHFNWDRHGANDDSSSEWVPMASPWAGGTHGIMFHPRVGDEVLVSFIQGDPDQPVITGSLYNSANMPPFTLPGNKTQSGFLTSSSLGGNGFNELMFEDAAGKEQILIHAQRDFNVTVLNNWSQTVNGNMTATIGGNFSLTAGTQISLNNPVSVTGDVTTTGTFKGDGSGLTSLMAKNLVGSLPAISGAFLTSLNAGNLTGVVPTSVLPGFQSPNYNTLSGGFGNNVSGGEATVGGGNANTATNLYATVGGGNSNIAGQRGSAVAGGVLNDATNTWATIGGGANNVAGGAYSTVPGGYQDFAVGTYSFAAGLQGEAMHQGTFVWADSQGTPFASTANNQFLIRAANGVGINTASPQQSLSVVGGMNIDQNSQNTGTTANALLFGSSSGEGVGSVRSGGYGDSYGLNFYTDFFKRMTILQNGNVGIGTTNATQLLVVGSGGAYCNGTSWVNGSDRNSKQDFRAVDPGVVLEKLSALPITEWQYKTEAEGTKHLGPMAQDFHEAFGLNGNDDKHISTVDEGGVALAAIQGLNQKLKEKDAEIQDLKTRLARLEGLMNSRLERGQ